jgi:TetR/AcrR family transcriptional regulator, tetracycline repressor protein
VGVTQRQVVDTAVRLLDEVGLEGLTLRRLAAELDVQAPALYWHVRSKRELLDLMAEAIIEAAVPVPLRFPAPGQPWWEWLTERTRAAWQGLLAHRDSALVVAGNRPTGAAFGQIDRLIGSLVSYGFPPDEAMRAIITLGSYATGCALEVQAAANRSPEDVEHDRVLFARMVDADMYPALAGAVVVMRAELLGKDQTFEHELFEYGLALVIDGLRARHARLTGLAEQDPSGQSTLGIPG